MQLIKTCKGESYNKRFWISIIFSVLLSGCTLTATEPKESDDEGVETKRIKSHVIEKYPKTMLNQMKFDIMHNGTEQSIEMYADVQEVVQDGQQEYAWDDGQRWLLIVRDGARTYPLFDDWVQLGKLTFWLIEEDDTPMLLLLSTGTAEFHLQSYVYDKQADEFIRKSIYSPPGQVNFWGSSS